MFDYEIEGQCPLCIGHRKMQGCGPARLCKSLSCDGMEYHFSSAKLWYCLYHGWFNYRRSRHVLFDFAKHRERVKRVVPLPEGAHSPLLADYMIVRMKCPYADCGHEWKQYDRTQLYEERYVICPECEAKIPKEEAIKDKRVYRKKKELLKELDEIRKELKNL